MLRCAFLLFVSAILAGCVSAKYDSYVKHTQSKKLPENTHYIVQITPAAKIDIRGVFDPTRGLSMGSPLYAADAGVAGLAAQIFVQAALVQEIQEQKLKDQKELANKVLKPFTKIVDKLSTANLKHASTQYAFSTSQVGSGQPNAVQWLLVSHPIFYVAQDTYRLSIKHVIEVRSIVNPKGAPVYGNRIEILGPVLPSESAIELLHSESKYGLQQQITRLYQQSLALAIKDLQGQFPENSGRYKTFKIWHGSTLQAERGKLLLENCGKKVIRNLRGWIMAFPIQDTSVSCESAVAGTSAHPLQ